MDAQFGQVEQRAALGNELSVAGHGKSIQNHCELCPSSMLSPLQEMLEVGTAIRKVARVLWSMHTLFQEVCLLSSRA